MSQNHIGIIDQCCRVVEAFWSGGCYWTFVLRFTMWCDKKTSFKNRFTTDDSQTCRHAFRGVGGLGLADLVVDLLDLLGGFRVCGHTIFNGFDGVHDGGVITTAEVTSDFL